MTGAVRSWCSHIVAVSLIAMPAALAAAPGSPASAAETLAYPVGYGTKPIDPRTDPWRPVSDATVRPLLTPKQRRARHAHRVVVDYDGDGIADAAWMVTNSRQMGVLVRLGGSGRVLLAYRADGRWSDQSLFRTRGGAIGIEFPESTVVELSAPGGVPSVYYLDEGEG